MIRSLLPLFFPFFLSLYAMEPKPITADIPETPSITIVPVKPTAEPNHTSLQILYPEDGQVVGSPVVLNFRLRGYSLGTRSYFERGEEILDQGVGQAVHIVVDNKPYMKYVGASVDPFDRDANFYEQNFQVELPFDLTEGEHTIRLFPARSFGESLKAQEAFSMVSFYVGNSSLSQKMSDPILTYNEPSPKGEYRENRPILLDFLMTNGILARGSYGVEVRIDGKVIDKLYENSPYYIYGLRGGKHTISLGVVDNNGNPLGGLYQKTGAVIRVR